MFFTEILNTLLEQLHQGSIQEGLHNSLRYLEKALKLDGITLIVRGPSRNTHTLIASSQMRNINGMPLTPSMKMEELEHLVPLSSPRDVHELCYQLEIDMERPRGTAAYYVHPIPSSPYQLIFVLVGPPERINTIQLESISKIYALLLRDSQLLRQMRERTNRVNINDFTKRKKVKEIETYRELLESTGDGILILDANYTIQYMNHSGESITGYARPTLAGTPLQDLLPHDHAQLFATPGAPLPSRFDLDLTTTSNELVHLSMNTSSLLAEAGLTVLFFRDVTEANLMEERLKSTSDFLMRLVDNSVVAIVASELNEKVILFNPSAQELFGYTPEEVMEHKRVSQLFPSQEEYNHLLDLVSDKNYSGAERMDPTKATILSSKNEAIPVNISAYTISLHMETTKAVVLFITDLRVQVQMEEKILEYKERLVEEEKKVIVSELAGAMAHELNQPLMSILGYATLLKKPTLDDTKRKRAINTISSEAERMGEIVKKIGNLTRYKTRKYVGTANIVDLEMSSEPRTT